LINAGFFFSAVLQLFIAVSMIVLVLEEARHICQQVEERIESVNSEKRDLQIKVLSTELKCRSLFQQARLQEQLQSAYDELRQTQQSVMQQERRALGKWPAVLRTSATPLAHPRLFRLLLKKAEPERRWPKQPEHPHLRRGHRADGGADG
jgi:hypothetical protein